MADVRLAREVRRLRAALEAIIKRDQIGGAPPPGATLRRVRGYNIETWDGESAKIAREALAADDRPPRRL